MKRLVALCVCVLFLSLLCACGAQTAVPLQCGSLAFSAGEYAYLLNRVMLSSDSDAGREALLLQTNEACRFYAALDLRLQNEGVRLSAPLKSDAAARTRGLWQFFSAHYRALGMEKSDLTRLMTLEQEEKALVQHLFGPGGKEEVKEAKLKKWFRESYVGFRAFSEPLTKENAGGETVPLSKAEQTALWQTFGEMKKRADSGTPLDTLFKEFSKSKGLLVTMGTEVQTLKKGDPTVSEAFFAAVQALETNGTAVLAEGARLYLVQKIDLLEDGTPYFDAARDEVLFEKKWPAAQNEVRKQAETLEMQTDERLCGEIYALVKAEHQAKA